VDDSEDELFLFRRAFERSDLKERWEIKSALGGEEALKYLDTIRQQNSPKPDLVLVDLKMPVVNGLEVLKWMQSNVPEVRAAVLSSSELQSDRNRANELGAVAYLPKAETFKAVIEFLKGCGQQ
jgi:CheY-like chemotaxis protein